MVMVMVNVDLYSAIITKVSNVLDTLVSGEKPVCCRFITESERVKKFSKLANILGDIIGKSLVPCFLTHS